MSNKEVPLQCDMFSDDLVDTRTRKQKRMAREAEGYQQLPMFSQREIAQFGVRARPTMPAVARNGKPLGMALEIEDPRTEEEKEADLRCEVERRTHPMFHERPEEDAAVPTPEAEIAAG